MQGAGSLLYGVESDDVALVFIIVLRCVRCSSHTCYIYCRVLHVLAEQVYYCSAIVDSDIVPVLLYGSSWVSSCSISTL